MTDPTPHDGPRGWSAGRPLLARFNARDFTWEGVAPGQYRLAEGETPTWRDVTRYTLVGRNSEPTAFHLRYFEILPGGYSSLEQHQHAHAVIVLRGRGRVVADGDVFDVSTFDFVFIPPDTPHQFINGGDEPFGFLCPVDAVRDRPRAVDPRDLEAAVRTALGFDKHK